MTLRSQVTMWVDDRGADKQIWFGFETEHESIKALSDELVTNGIVAGWRLETQPMGQGVRRITRRYEFVVAKDAVVSISAPQFQFAAEPDRVSA